MPELPEVQTVVNGLQKRVINKIIVNAEFSNKNFRGKSLNLDLKLLENTRVIKCQRRAKYILIYLSNNFVLLIHLGMSGKLLIEDKNISMGSEETHVHLQITFEDDMKLKFIDPRRFGMIKIFHSSKLCTEELLINVGVEPFDEKFDFQVLSSVCANRKSTIKSVLMNANLIAGIGNIYASEALFLAEILPNRLANTITNKESEHLHKSIINVLNEAIESGGSTLRDYVRSDGDKGSFQHKFRVYGRNGKPCKNCNSSIEKIIIAGRATFFCPKCQI